MAVNTLITTIPATLNKLDVIQFQALRFVAGAIKSTPLASMQALTTNNPLKNQIQKMALILYKKIDMPTLQQLVVPIKI